MTDDFTWVPLKEYAADVGKHPRTVLTWIKLGHLEAKRDGPMPHAPWLVKVIREEQKTAWGGC